jgi:hypothetical protein
MAASRSNKDQGQVDMQDILAPHLEQGHALIRLRDLKCQHLHGTGARYWIQTTSAPKCADTQASQHAHIHRPSGTLR